MKKLKCIVIDDDPMMTDLIQHFCSKISEVEYCLTCNDSISGLKMLSSEQYDVLFLDYNMPEISGRGILEMKTDKSQVVMITSHADFAVESYNYNGILDFILKPVSFERFAAAIEKVVQNKAGSQDPTPKEDIIYFKDGKKWLPINKQNILFIKSESNYAKIVTANKSLMSLVNLKDIEQDLSSDFIRVHRSYIINIKHLDFIKTDLVSVGGNEIPISNKYKDAVMKLVQ